MRLPSFSSLRNLDIAADPKGSANADRAGWPRLLAPHRRFRRACREGMIAAEHLALFAFADDPEEGWEVMLQHGIEAHTPAAAGRLWLKSPLTRGLSQEAQDFAGLIGLLDNGEGTGGTGALPSCGVEPPSDENDREHIPRWRMPSSSSIPLISGIWRSRIKQSPSLPRTASRSSWQEANSRASKPAHSSKSRSESRTASSPSRVEIIGCFHP